MKRLFENIAGKISGLPLDQLEQKLATSGAARFYTLAAVIGELKSTGEYKKKYTTVEEWAWEEFQMTRVTVSRYEKAWHFLDRLNRVSNWIHLPTAEFQCRTLEEYQFDELDLKAVWNCVEGEVDRGQRLSAKMIDGIAQSYVAGLQEAEPEHYNAVLESVAPTIAAKVSQPGALVYEPLLGFADYSLDWQADPSPKLPQPMGGNCVLVNNIGQFGEFQSWAIDNREWVFLALAKDVEEYADTKIVPNVWPGFKVDDSTVNLAAYVAPHVESSRKWGLFYIGGEFPGGGPKLELDWAVIWKADDIDGFRGYLSRVYTPYTYFVPNWAEFEKEKPSEFVNSNKHSYI